MREESPLKFEQQDQVKLPLVMKEENYAKLIS